MAELTSCKNKKYLLSVPLWEKFAGPWCALLYHFKSVTASSFRACLEVPWLVNLRATWVTKGSFPPLTCFSLSSLEFGAEKSSKISSTIYGSYDLMFASKAVLYQEQQDHLRIFLNIKAYSLCENQTKPSEFSPLPSKPALPGNRMGSIRLTEAQAEWSRTAIDRRLHTHSGSLENRKLKLAQKQTQFLLCSHYRCKTTPQLGS